VPELFGPSHFSVTTKLKNMSISTSSSQFPVLSLIILCSARILTCLILGIWLFFIVAHLFGDAGAPSRPLTIGDYAILTAMLVSLLGLGLALKWVRFGAALTLVAVAFEALLNWKVLLLPPGLIPITAGLFLASSFLSSSPSTTAIEPAAH